MVNSMKQALFTVTYGGLWYEGEALPLKKQIDKAKEIGFDGISIEAKRPVASPVDFEKEEIREVKNYADSQNIEICAIESMSNFASPVMEKRENNLAMMKLILKMADSFDVDTVKIFAAWPGVNWEPGNVGKYEDLTPPEAPFSRDYLKKWQRAKKGITEVAEWAEDFGIDIALQNHPPLLRPGYEDALAMVREIGKENMKLCLDVPLFYERQSKEYIKEAVEECGDLITLSHYGAWNIEGTKEGKIKQVESSLAGKKINYEDFINELKNVGYDDYMVQELCLPVIEKHEFKGIDKVEQDTKTAFKYMKELISG